jgi:hypothetical protein
VISPTMYLRMKTSPSSIKTPVLDAYVSNLRTPTRLSYLQRSQAMTIDAHNDHVKSPIGTLQSTTSAFPPLDYSYNDMPQCMHHQFAGHSTDPTFIYAPICALPSRAETQSSLYRRTSAITRDAFRPVPTRWNTLVCRTISKYIG